MVEISDFQFVILVGLAIVGLIVCLSICMWIVMWPFKMLWRIDTGQDVLLEDMKEIKDVVTKIDKESK